MGPLRNDTHPIGKKGAQVFMAFKGSSKRPGQYPVARAQNQGERYKSESLSQELELRLGGAGEQRTTPLTWFDKHYENL